MRMITLSQSFEFKSRKPFVETTDYEYSLYDVMKSIQEDYYNNLIQETKKRILIGESASSAILSVFEKLINSSAKFLNYITVNNRLVHIETRAIKRMIETDKTHTFQFKQYFIDDIRYAIPEIPDDYGKSFDKTIFLKRMIRDPAMSENANQSYFFSGRVPVWTLKYKTVESMLKYMKKQTPYAISKGVYSVKDLLSMIEEVSKDSSEYFVNIKELVVKSNSQLNHAMDNYKKMKKNLMDTARNHPEYSIRTICDDYENKVIPSAFLHLSVYYRAAMMMYGKVYTSIANVIHAMYDDTSDYVKKTKYNEKIEDSMKNFVKDLL